MDRRDFMKMAGVAGLTLASPLASNIATAQEGPYTGKFIITINAGGGWDPTSFIDPKGAIDENDPNPMNNSYFKDDIVPVGPFNVAPLDGTDGMGLGIQGFFEKRANEIMVINGIDTETNGHDSGSRNTWSGNLQEGSPSFAALVAANENPRAPMAYVSNGGYDFTAGLVARTRSGNTNALIRIAYPNRINPDDLERYYHTEDTMERIQQLQDQRLDTQLSAQGLPKLRHSMNRLYTARAGTADIGRLTEALPDELDDSGNRLRRQAQVAIAAYKAGIAISANLNTGGFDTHGNHDANHIPRVAGLLDGFDFVLEEAERQGVADKIIVMAGSDFGRTPGYNDGQGKDHWPITSMIFAGSGIPKGKLIGATTERHGPMKVNPNNLQSVPDEDATGVRITPAHVHRALRDMMSIDEDFERQYPLTVETKLNLFNA